MIGSPGKAISKTMQKPGSNAFHRLVASGGFLFAILIPFSFFFPIGEPMEKGILPIYGSRGVFLTDLAIIWLLVSGLRHLLRKIQGGAIQAMTTGKWIGAILCGFAWMAAIYSFAALSPELAIWTATRWTVGAVLFWLLLNIDLPIEAFIKVFILSLAVQVLIGLGQVVTTAPLGLPGEMALTIDSPRAAVIISFERTWLRAYGMTFHPNVLGGFLMVGLTLGLPFLQSKFWRLVWFWLGFGLFFTFSRSAWLAAAVVIPLAGGWVAWKAPQYRRIYIRLSGGMAVLLIVLAAVFAKPLIARIFISESYSETTSLIGRAELTRIALASVQHHPVTGIGAGNFPLVQLQYKTLDPPHYVHNVPLLLAAEIGILGGLLWLALWVIPVFQRSLQRHPEPLTVTLVAAWFGLGIIALWDSYPWALESGRLLTVLLLSFVAKSDSSKS